MRLLFFLGLFFSSTVHSQLDSAGGFPRPDTLSGEVITYFESGAIQSKGNYINGKRHGEFLHYFENGEMEYRVYHLQDIKQAWIMYGEDGHIKQSSHNNLTYHSNGTVASIGDKADHVYIKFYDNGQLMVWMNFKDGLAQGESVSYHKSGQLWATGSYLDNKETGEWMEYWSNGNLYKKGSYNAGQKVGEWIIGSEDGKSLQIINY